MAPLSTQFSVHVRTFNFPDKDRYRMSTPIDGTAVTSLGSDDRGFFGHPWGLSTLFFTEMWERFSYYGMRAILFLYMTAKVTEGGLGWDEKDAGPIFGLYAASVYFLPLI